MLETIDLFVGLAVVMLVISFAVTVITQAIVAFFNLRGVALWQKLSNLLTLLDGGIGTEQAKAIASEVLKDRLIARGFKGPVLGWGQVVHREELTKLLLSFAVDRSGKNVPSSAELAAAATSPAPPPQTAAPSLRLGDLQRTVRDSLEHNGIADPAATMKAIRMAVLDLEKSHPELSNSQRANAAILRAADSDFVGKLNAWFDQTVDRASDSFTSSTHIIAVIVAFIVAFTLQLDTIGLINRLSTDRAVRSKLVDWAIKNEPQIDSNALAPRAAASAANAAAQPASNGAAANSAADTATPTVGDRNGPIMAAARDQLLSDKLLVLPTSREVWMQRWASSVSCAVVMKWSHETGSPAVVGDACPLPRVNLWGVVLSAILLSLGGPFWYEALKNLLKLRSLVASKDDDQRLDRQTNTADAASTGVGASQRSPNRSDSEMGD